MPGDDWTWSRLTRAGVRDHGRAVVAAAMKREGFATSLDGAVVQGSRDGVALEAHIRTLRTPVYAFWEKRRFELSAKRFAALVLLIENAPPAAYLVPSLHWQQPNALLVSRDYEGLASEPEWGLNLSGRTMPVLEQYRIARMLRSLGSQTER